jgi:hypothetical protein
VKAKVLDTRTRMGALAEGWVDAMVVLAFFAHGIRQPQA